MGTRLLDYRKERKLQPANLLWNLYNSRKCERAFMAETSTEAKHWQSTTRRALTALLGIDSLPKASLSPKLIEKVDKGDYIREKILVRTTSESLMPVYMLVPKNGRKTHPAVIAFHGHGYGVKDIVGLWEDGQERSTPDGYHKDFGVALCRRGFLVAAPEISCFGERRSDFSHLNGVIGEAAPSTCTHSAMLAFHLGLSVVGLRIHDGMRLVDYLATRKDVELDRLGAMGISGGGMHTFFSTCVDERIKACVVSGYFCSFRRSILGINHCACNFIPGLRAFGDIHDLAGLIAPRPMLIEAGSYDPIFPIQAVRQSVCKARRIYKVFGADNIETDYFEGRHQISGVKAYDFLAKELNLGGECGDGRVS